MSGTDHAQAADGGARQPVIILVRPQMGENIGAAARAMWNFGLERMRLVAPRDGWPNPAAVAMSSGAARVLDQVQVHDSLAEAIADCTYVYATTARARDLTKDVATPEHALADAASRSARGERVAILFGPERAGLENADIVQANAIISVPVNPAFASLNLGQCVLLTAYEWGRQSIAAAPIETEMAGTRPANHVEVEKLYDRLRSSLDRAGFFWPEHKADSMQTSLRNLISRLPLTDADIRMLHGVIRTLVDKSPNAE